MILALANDHDWQWNGTTYGVAADGWVWVWTVMRLIGHLAQWLLHCIVQNMNAQVVEVERFDEAENQRS